MNDQTIINLMKALVIDGVSKAKSGHPGGAMSSMDFVCILFKDYLNFNPDDSAWEGRDRFVLSAGHESMLLYSILFAIGWLDKEDLKNFRQINSITPGHPEVNLTPGVECSTGPLGQGAAMSVGMSIAAEYTSSFLKSSLLRNKTWALLGDGCMQEGVTYSAASLAGHLKLENLIWYYDKNDNQISGHISLCISDNFEDLYKSLGWHVITINAHNHSDIHLAIKKALSNKNKPTLIIGNSIIAKGAYKQEGSYKTHGAPLKEEFINITKSNWGIPDKKFFWPEEASIYFQERFQYLRSIANNWKSELKQKRQHKDFEEKYNFIFENNKIDKNKVNWDLGSALATRSAFGKILEFYSDKISLIGGSADLAPSNMTEDFAHKVGDFNFPNYSGRNINFGVREFPMAAICNGISLYNSKLIPFSATFLTFSDYSRAAMRLGAIQELRVIHELTHDSFYLGEDGPTHQPIEHLASLRAMPNMYVMRPADARETEFLFKKSITLNGPSAFCLSRQKLKHLSCSDEMVQLSEKGAWYIIEEKSPDFIFFATGSEVNLAIDVIELIKNNKQLSSSLVSVPCWELFFEQKSEYKNYILSKNIKKRISIEAGSALGWERFVGESGLIISIDRYGESAPSGDLAEKFDFTAAKIYDKVIGKFVT